MALIAIIISVIALGAAVLALINSRPKKIVKLSHGDYNSVREKAKKPLYGIIDDMPKAMNAIDPVEHLIKNGFTPTETKEGISYSHKKCSDMLLENNGRFAVTKLPTGRTYPKSELMTTDDIICFEQFVNKIL